MNPTSWSASDVEDWAIMVGLSESTISCLRQNEINGPTLVTLEKDDLRSELGIGSLPARRYLWDLILTLRSQQENSDHTTAIYIFEEEIESMPLKRVVLTHLEETSRPLISPKNSIACQMKVRPKSAQSPLKSVVRPQSAHSRSLTEQKNKPNFVARAKSRVSR